MSILILLDSNRIKKLYPPTIILGPLFFALKIFFPKDQVMFSTNNKAF